MVLCCDPPAIGRGIVPEGGEVILTVCLSPKKAKTLTEMSGARNHRDFDQAHPSLTRCINREAPPAAMNAQAAFAKP
jgi:hypothetical protein